MRKGSHCTLETRAKMRLAALGESNPNYGKHPTLETRAKMRASRAAFSGERHPMWGKHHTAEAKEKNRLAHIGKHQSLEAREKNRIAHTGESNTMKRPETRAKVTGKGNPFYGRRHTAETRTNMRANSGMKHPEVRARISKTRAEGIISGRIRSKNRGKCGLVFSTKMNKSIYVESSYEARAIRMFDGDSAIISFIKNPCKIPYQFEGKDHHYIPDFETLDVQGHRSLAEVLAKYTLANPQRQAKLEAGRRFAEDSGMDFYILTGDDLPQDRVMK